jgi:hypothetical protein
MPCVVSAARLAASRAGAGCGLLSPDAGPCLAPLDPRSDPCWRPCSGVRCCPHAQPAPCPPAFLCLLLGWRRFGCAHRRPPLPYRPLRPIPRLAPVLTSLPARPPAMLRCCTGASGMHCCVSFPPARLAASRLLCRGGLRRMVVSGLLPPVCGTLPYPLRSSF